MKRGVERGCRGEECGGMFERLYEQVVWETQSVGCLIPSPILRYGNETVY